MRMIPLLLVFAGCSAGIGPGPPAPEKKYACNEGYACPQGQDCVKDCCGGPPCSTDYFEARPPSPPVVVLGPAEGCVSGTGYELVAGKGYACPGKVTGGAKKQCVTGLPGGDYLPCTTSRSLVLFSQALQSFFAAAQPIEQIGDTTQCGYVQTDPTIEHYIAGLGGSAKDYVRPLPAPCAGWTNIVRVDATPSTGWTVPLSHPPVEGDIVNVSNDNADDGVICCRNLGF